MKKKHIYIDKDEFVLFEITVFQGTPNESTILVAEERLNDKIEQLIKQNRYHEVKELDDMYHYWVPQEIADDECEFEIVDSIESVMLEDLDLPDID